MGRKNKLQKFSDLLGYPNVVENLDYLNPVLMRGIDDEVDFKGHWSSKFFKNTNPLILELACGRGEYTVALAASNPQNNYLGVDIKGARIWKGAKFALENNITNAGFLRTRIEGIAAFFDSNEVDEIWITFPDPFLSKERNRLTHFNFLNRYATFLKPSGIIHLKTDDPVLYEFSLESFSAWGRGSIEFYSDDIYASELYNPDLIHKTYYELKHLEIGRKIKYIKYRLDQSKQLIP